jgi:hypothetical protein
MGEYTRVTFHGKETDQRTALMAKQVEKRIGKSFACYQGSYSGSVTASAGTHDGGGALDLNVPSGLAPSVVVRRLRDNGFAAWYRTPAQGFMYHIHAIDLGGPLFPAGNQRLSTGARVQVKEYVDGDDGLAGDQTDSQPYRPTPVEAWSWDDYMAQRRLRDRLSELGGRLGRLLARVRRLRSARRQAQHKLDKLS